MHICSDWGKENLIMVIHPIEPIYDKSSKILILGSFPSVKSREEVFFYGHKQNRFWKVIQSSHKCGLEYGKASECLEDYKKVLTLPLGQPLLLSNNRMKYV